MTVIKLSKYLKEIETGRLALGTLEKRQSINVCRERERKYK